MKNLLRPSLGLHIAYLFIATMTVINISSCGIVAPNTNVGELDKLVEMSKGPCFGFCPIYTLTVYSNGVVTYYGERNTNRQGTYLRILDKNKLSALKTQLEAANLWQFQDLYKGLLPDLQTVTITYWEEGDFKTIAGKDGRPKAVVDIETELESIANSGNWKKMEGEEATDEAPLNELIIQFVDGVNQGKWIKKYAKQDGKIVKQLAPNSLYWLMSFDPKKIKHQEMLRMVRRDKNIVSAELNKKVSTRGR